MRFPEFKLLLSGITLLCVLNNAVADEAALFDDAYAAYKNRDTRTLAAIAPRLQNYPLAPYLDYWQSLLKLEELEADAVRAQLERHADFPFSQRLRAEWLKTLGKQQKWDLLLAESAKLESEDAAVACYATLARLEAENDGQIRLEILREAKPVWMSGSDRPSACDDLFAAMQKRGVISEADVWARMRLAFRINQASVARAVSRYLSTPPTAKQLKLFDRVYENPQNTLEKKSVSLKSRLGRELNLYALNRVARGKPELALEYWEGMRSSYSEPDQAYIWGWLATHAARNHLPRALQLFEKAGDTPLEEEQFAWKARAALRAGNWAALDKIIGAMPSAMQEQHAWRYWKGRAIKESGNTVAANALWLPLAREPGYYGQLAQESLGGILSNPANAYRATEQDVTAIEKIPAVQRAVLLYRHDLRWESRQEWQKIIKTLDDKQLIAAAEFAFRQEWYDLAINTADKTRITHDFALRYPTPYRDLLKNFARENDLDEAWVYGLIRQESRFISHARSSVGAAGLMQVMPATASWIAKQTGFTGYQTNMIHQLETNIRFGSWYLKHVLDKMRGQPVMATAAYNAGPGRAKRWADQTPLEGAIYTETIPFNETRDYVQKVMGNAQYYARQLGTQQKPLSQRLGAIPGKESEENIEQSVQGEP